MELQLSAYEALKIDLMWIRLLGNKLASEVMGARPVVLLGTANEAMVVSFFKFHFLKGLLQFAITITILVRVGQNIV